MIKMKLKFKELSHANVLLKLHFMV